VEDPNQPQRNYSVRRIFVIVESKCNLAALCDCVQIDKSMFVDCNLRNCQKKGTMYKMQKMQKTQKTQKNQSEESSEGSPSVNICPDSMQQQALSQLSSNSYIGYCCEIS